MGEINVVRVLMFAVETQRPLGTSVLDSKDMSKGVFASSSKSQGHSIGVKACEDKRPIHISNGLGTRGNPSRYWEAMRNNVGYSERVSEVGCEGYKLTVANLS
jgi:hypothetical protein